MLPVTSSHHLNENNPLILPSAANLECKISFVTSIFANRITDAAKMRGTPRDPAAMPEDQYLWTTYHASLAKMFQVINDGLSSKDEDVVLSMLLRIVDMLAIDVCPIFNFMRDGTVSSDLSLS